MECDSSDSRFLTATAACRRHAVTCLSRDKAERKKENKPEKTGQRSKRL